MKSSEATQQASSYAPSAALMRNKTSIKIDRSTSPLPQPKPSRSPRVSVNATVHPVTELKSLQAMESTRSTESKQTTLTTSATALAAPTQSPSSNSSSSEKEVTHEEASKSLQVCHKQDETCNKEIVEDLPERGSWGSKVS